VRLLVTGGAGFIGSHYVRGVLDGSVPVQGGPPEVTVFDALTYAGNLANLAAVEGRYTFVHGDITDAELLADVLPGHQGVVNFAAETHVDRSVRGPGRFVTTNVVGVQTLLEECLRAGVRVVQVSTDEVYGSIEGGSWTESSPLEPNSPYSAAKAGGDLLARAYARTFGLDVRVTRCSNNYGPYQFPEKLIPLFVTRLIDGATVPLYGDGGNVRDWLHASDHVRGVQLVLERGEPGGIYHIGGGTELTNRELTQRLLDAFGVGWDRVEAVPDRPGHDRRYALSDARLRALGYAPLVTFEEGLADTIRWYRDHEDWWRPLLAAQASG
jgi:dTDP-glucose 4,6-dehydratase